MNDKDEILEKLKKSAKDPEQGKFLLDLCKEIFGSYYDGSTKAVTGLLQEKVKPLKDKFNDAHKRLLREVGLQGER